ncbi:MAG: molybdopterin molybdotransferase MoeA [Dehalococcoidia bacterium]|nr:molybdopterin molybdotransferase MoeA [Dehalococcoidia bacterium]
MLSVEEALDKILGYVHVLETEEKPLLDALGQVLAQDVTAEFAIPPLDNTAMDGYAVRAVDTEGATLQNPKRLPVAGELAAGAVYEGELQPGTAVRIMTGAPMPGGADAVVPFEDTDEPSGREFGTFAKPVESVAVYRSVKKGDNVRYAGEDIAAGARVIPKGTLLRASHVGALAAMGSATVRVIRRPVVAVLSTGDELVPLGQPLGPGQIHDSNTYSVSALVKESGGIPKVLGIAADNVDALTAKVRGGLDADMLLTSAGVSRGDYDVVKDVLAREGEIAFWTVRMKPGKPLAFGTFAGDAGRVPHIGFPGNPVSSMISFELFARPAIFKMMGKTGWQRPTLRVVVEDRIANRDRRRIFARAVVSERDGRYYASLTGPQGSGVLTSMMIANALAIVPEDVPEVRPGDELTAMMLRWSREDG